MSSVPLTRRSSDRMIAGVAGGVADALGVPDTYVRAAFITLATVWGLGILLYVVLWLVAYEHVGDPERRQVEPVQAVGLLMAFVGLMSLLAFGGWWPNPALVLTAGALTFGTAALTDSSRPGPLAALLDPNVDRPGRLRLILGALLLIAGLSIFARSVGAVFELGVVFVAAILTGLGMFVVFGPWVRRLAGDLARERTERIRQEERAEMASHLHDSVLQTLALIQRTDDPARMAILARHQESELRRWLYGASPLDELDRMSAALRRAAERVETDHGVPVEMVTVGDISLDERGRALVAAASEAMVNAAKHSGSSRISLYLEVDEGESTVIVTDQGRGFDPDDVPEDRRGIASSIRQRVESAGGSVEIVSERGEGTEVVLKMPGVAV